MSIIYSRNVCRWIVLIALGIFAAEADHSVPAEEQWPPLIHAHAHNDYEHAHPLFDALDHGFASVEADIFLVDGHLLVAHDRKKLNPLRTLESLYLDPLRVRARRFDGRIYPNGDPTFYLLIDTKTDTNSTWIALQKVLRRYSDLLTEFDGEKITPKAVTVVLTGNRPRDLLAKKSKRLAALDGQIPDLDHPNTNGIFLWMSEDWRHFFAWNGVGAIPPEEKSRLREVVTRSHQRKMKVRFWDAPQSTNFWHELRGDGVDLINADDLAGLEKFLRRESDSDYQ